MLGSRLLPCASVLLAACNKCLSKSMALGVARERLQGLAYQQYKAMCWHTRLKAPGLQGDLCQRQFLLVPVCWDGWYWPGLAGHSVQMTRPIYHSAAKTWLAQGWTCARERFLAENCCDCLLLNTAALTCQRVRMWRKRATAEWASGAKDSAGLVPPSMQRQAADAISCCLLNTD